MAQETFSVLILLDIDGERIGFSETAAVTVDGQAFGQGLISYSLPARSASFVGGGSSPSGGSVNLSVALERRNLALLANVAGARPQRWTGRVWAWQPGQTLTEAVDVFRGRVTSPSVDINNGTFSCSLSPSASAIDTPFPPAVVGDEGRFPSAPDSSKTAACSVIYGTAIGVPLAPLAPQPALIGVPVPYLVAGHEIYSGWVLVKLEDVSIPGSPYKVRTAVDGRGDTYSYVEVLSQYYNESLYATPVVGIKGPNGPVELLGDVLIDMWQRFGNESFFELDRQRIFAAQTRLNRYKVGAFFNSRTTGQTMLRIIGSRFGEQFPVLVQAVGGRYGWDAIDLPLDGASPVATLIYGQNAFERSAITWTDSSQVRNRFEIRYALDGFAGGTTKTARRGPENDGLCRGSLAVWGETPLLDWEASDVPDSGTAVLLLQDQIRRLARVRVRVKYAALDPRFLALPLQRIVLVTDVDLGWDEHELVIESVNPRVDGRVDLGLVELRGR